MYKYKGYVIEKVAPGQWNISKVGDDYVIDAADTLAGAKYLINCWLGRN